MEFFQQEMNSAFGKLSLAASEDIAEEKGF